MNPSPLGARGKLGARAVLKASRQKWRFRTAPCEFALEARGRSKAEAPQNQRRRISLRFRPLRKRPRKITLRGREGSEGPCEPHRPQAVRLARAFRPSRPHCFEMRPQSFLTAWLFHGSWPLCADLCAPGSIRPIRALGLTLLFRACFPGASRGEGG